MAKINVTLEEFIAGINRVAEHRRQLKTTYRKPKPQSDDTNRTTTDESDEDSASS